MSKQPFMVKPISSAGDKDIANNIVTNMDLIDTWFERHKKNDKHCWIISAGPSTRMFLTKHKSLLQKGEPIFCIKHALPLLKDAGIEPDYCVVLDPRDINKVSTLGHKRVDLYNTAPKSTVFCVASMTHPSVTKHLLSEGYKVLGWHALTPEMQIVPDDYKARLGGMLITGGTSSGTRSEELSFYMGYTRKTVVGFDSSFDKPKPTNIKDAKGKQKYLKITVNEKPFYTTGELVAQAQDFERIIMNPKYPADVRIFDCGLETSLVNELVKQKGNPLWPEKVWSKNIV